MKVIFTWKELIILNGCTEIARYPASCKVRTELNGQRDKDQIVYTYPTTGKPEPYYPRQFPSGIFEITEIEYTDDSEYAPVKIKTNARRRVFTWEVDSNGHYSKPTGDMQIDTCYWLHFTNSRTTLGCIKISDIHDALSLAHIIDPELRHGDPVYLEVL